jgi:multiple sugar transport system ATP-binding protein
MGQIDLNNVVKVFDGAVRAVDGVSLTIADGEFVVLVGPSGCGKSTLLRMIAGLETVTDGAIAIDGRDVTDVGPRERDIAMVFQNYALYPHMTVRRNLGYGLRVRGVDKEEINRRVEEVARTLVLDELLERRPRQLSGGQRQRVAIGRAMVREPVVYLMDEPLSNLDAKLRVSMRAELARLHGRLGVTTVYVTHDQVEAMTLGERVAVMRDGVVQQIDRPQVLYDSPANLFVAAFIGSPSMNLATAVVEGHHVKLGGVAIPLGTRDRPATLRDGPVVLGVRPEALSDAAFADPSAPQLEAVTDVIEELGSDVHVVFPLDAPGVDSADLRAASDGERESLFADDRARFTARFDRRSRARAGAPVRVAVDPATLYFFDPETGESLGGTPAAATVAQPAASERAAAQ